MLLGVFILLFILLSGSYCLSRQNIFSPGVLTTSIWLFCLLLFVTLPHSLPDLSGKFLGCLSIWTVCLVMSSLFIQSFRFPVIMEQANLLIRNIYLIITACSLTLFLIWVVEIMQLNGSWQSNLRLAAIGKLKHYEPYNGFLVIICQVSYALELYYFSSRQWWRLLLPVSFMLLFGFFTLSKIVFFWIFILTVCILYFKHYIKIKHIIIGLLTLFAAFFILQSVRNRAAFENKEDKNGFIVLYSLSSMSAFDVTAPKSCTHKGENTFRFLYAIGYKLGISSIPPINPLLPFIKKPITTNTYTGMYPYYKDFGVTGILLAALVAGLLYGLVFKGAQMGSDFFVILYAYVAVIIIQQYISDTLMTNIVGHVKFCFLLFLPFWVNKYKLLQNR